MQFQADPSMKRVSAQVSEHPNFGKAVTCKSMKDVQDATNTILQEIITEICRIKDEPIHIQCKRNAGPVMTLIDLLGVTHVDVKNEAFDIHSVTAGMVKKYVSDDNMVVLVVIPASDDFGNSEALRIAQAVDPKGVHTIGVLYPNAIWFPSVPILLKFQMNRDFDVKLALGFIAVRSGGPGEDDIDIDAREERLFLSHRLLSLLSKEQSGYTALIESIAASELESRVNAVKQVTKAILVVEQRQTCIQNVSYLERIRKFKDFLSTATDDLTVDESEKPR